MNNYVYAEGTPNAEFKQEVIIKSGVTGFNIYEEKGIKKISIDSKQYNEILEYVQKEVEESLIKSKGLKTDIEIVEEFFEKKDGNKQQTMVQKIRSKIAENNNIIPGSIRTTLPYETRQTIIETLQKGKGVVNQGKL